MEYSQGKYIIDILMIVLALKYFYMLYAVGKEYSRSSKEDGLKRDKAKSARETRKEQKTYTHTENKKTYEKQQPKQQKIHLKLSRFAKELMFFESSKDPFILLGCTAYSSNTELKKNYRKLIIKWHPDRIMGMGASREELNQAKKISQIINWAYKEAVMRNNPYAKSA